MHVTMSLHSDWPRRAQIVPLDSDFTSSPEGNRSAITKNEEKDGRARVSMTKYWQVLMYGRKSHTSSWLASEHHLGRKVAAVWLGPWEGSASLLPHMSINGQEAQRKRTHKP